MARQNIYMKQKTLDGIRKLVDERKAEGASSAEANISSVGSELLEIGLRVTEQIKKKVNVEKGESPEEIFNRNLLEECVKSRIAIQELFRMIFNLDEIRMDTRFNYALQVEKMKSEIIDIVDKSFPY